jgi:hypothetical protein
MIYGPFPFLLILVFADDILILALVVIPTILAVLDTLLLLRIVPNGL